jgi:shikimate dehydrogenase
MKIDGKTRVCGLIGNPVEHSISPLIHNTVSELMGINLSYVTFKVNKEDIEAAVKGAAALGILGMNVTVPHKQAVIPYLHDIDPMAKAIGAVNTLVFTGDGYKGYNTDITGFHRSLLEENVAIKDETVVVLGAGGASRAIAFLLAGEGAARIYLLNRTVDKAESIANAVNTYNNKDIVIPLSISAYNSIPEERFLCVQTTSVGLFPNVNDAVITDPEFYKRIHTAMDIIYNPAETRFMKLARENGAAAYNGLKMLLYQGIAAYELWNDIKVGQDVIESVHIKMKEALGIND